MYVWRIRGVAGGKERTVYAVSRDEHAMPNPSRVLGRMPAPLSTLGWDSIASIERVGQVPAVWAEGDDWLAAIEGGAKAGA